MKKISSKVLAIMLSLCMMVPSMSMPAMAAETDETSAQETSQQQNESEDDTEDGKASEEEEKSAEKETSNKEEASAEKETSEEKVTSEKKETSVEKETSEEKETEKEKTADEKSESVGETIVESILEDEEEKGAVLKSALNVEISELSLSNSKLTTHNNDSTISVKLSDPDFKSGSIVLEYLYEEKSKYEWELSYYEPSECWLGHISGNALLQDGEFELKAITVKDDSDNSTIITEGLSAGNFTRIMDETDAPEIDFKTLSVSSKEATVGDTLEFSMKATDEGSGTNYAQLQFVNESYGSYKDVYIYYDESSGLMKGSLDITEGMIDGNWKIGYICLSDNNYNILSFGTDWDDYKDIDFSGFDFTLTNTNPDTTAPVIDASTIKIEQSDSAKTELESGDSMLTSVTVTDDVAGVNYVRAYYISEDGSEECVYLYRENENENIYSGYFNVDDSKDYGTWKLEKIEAYDNNNNKAVVYDSDIYDADAKEESKVSKTAADLSAYSFIVTGSDKTGPDIDVNSLTFYPDNKLTKDNTSPYVYLFVYDSGSVKTVTFVYESEDGKTYNFELSDCGCSEYDSYINSSDLEADGKYTLKKIIATDNHKNTTEISSDTQDLSAGDFTRNTQAPVASISFKESELNLYCEDEINILDYLTFTMTEGNEDYEIEYNDVTYSLSNEDACGIRDWNQNYLYCKTAGEDASSTATCVLTASVNGHSAECTIHVSHNMMTYVSKIPTVSEEGERIHICASWADGEDYGGGCGYKETEVIPKLDKEDMEAPVIDFDSIEFTPTEVSVPEAEEETEETDATVKVSIPVSDKGTGVKYFKGYICLTAHPDYVKGLYFTYNEDTKRYEAFVGISEDDFNGKWQIGIMYAFDYAGNYIAICDSAYSDTEAVDEILDEDYNFDFTAQDLSSCYFTVSGAKENATGDFTAPVADISTFTIDKETAYYGDTVNFTLKATDEGGSDLASARCSICTAGYLDGEYIDDVRFVDLEYKDGLLKGSFTISDTPAGNIRLRFQAFLPMIWKADSMFTV